MMNCILGEQWAQHLAIRIESMRHDTEIALAARTRTSDDPAEYTLTASAIRDRLSLAIDAITRPEHWWHWLRGRSPLDHWRGLSVVGAFENVHAAEVFLVDLRNDEEVRAGLPSVLARGKAVLDPDDPRRCDLEELGRRHGPVDRDRFKEAMRAGFLAEDQIYLRIRTFRNLVVKCTVLLVVLIALMVWLIATHPGSLPLCFRPDPGSMICPSGADHPIAEDIMIVAGLGVLGSAAAAAFSIRGIQGIPTPYDVPVALAFFKLPLGALTAMTGLLLLGANFVPGLSELDNQRQILAYALTFGYAQQLVSRLVDDRARIIVSRLPVPNQSKTSA